MGGISVSLNNLDFHLNAFNDPIETKSKYKTCPSINDKVSLYYLLGNDYRSIAEDEWIIHNDHKKCAANLYLYLLARIRSYELKNEGICITNLSVKKAIEQKEWIEHFLYTAILLNETEMIKAHICKDSAVYSLLCGDHCKAETLIKKLPECTDDNAVYFENEIYLKNILEAIIEKNENKFNLEIEKRIKRIRKNAVGYMTILDVTSIALIKIAGKYGLSYRLNFIEIPNEFINNTLNYNKEDHKLPSV